MSAAAITWAISPPITPAPTTAALKTNMGPTLAIRPELDLRLALVGEARDGAAQRVGHGPSHEQEVDDRRERRAVLDPVLERERDLDGLRPRLEGDLLRAGHRGVLDLERLPEAHLVGDDALGDAAAAA